jgi:hypothetical protein
LPVFWRFENAIGNKSALKTFAFPAASGKTYRIEASLDLKTSTTVESGIAGNGADIQRFYTTRNMPKRYFRVEESAP